MEPDWAEIGRRLKLQRTEQGMSQEAVTQLLADDFGVVVNKSMVSRWEAGEKIAEPDYLFALERVLDLPVGSVSRLAGYVPAATVGFADWEEAILAELPDDDPRTELLARGVVEMVRVAIRQGKQIRRGGG